MRQLLAVFVLGALAAPARAADVASDPVPGVHHVVRTLAGPPALRVHILVVDLSSQELHLHVTTPDKRGLTPSAWAAATGQDVAVNANLFDPVGYLPVGLAMGEGTAWPGSADDGVTAAFLWDSGKAAASLPPAAMVLGASPAGVDLVVSGRPAVLEAGAVPGSFDCGDALATPCDRMPRSALGLSADGLTLVLVVADGWSAASAGMTAGEVGQLLQSFGAADGFLFDGGGSSALYLEAEGGVVSAPSDGVERPVAASLGISYGALPPGQLIGFVRDGDIFDTSKGIAGALVKTDDGQSTTTSSFVAPDNYAGRYSFSGLRPRLVCVTASHAGYRTKTQCKQVQPNATEFNSIALEKDTGPIDAGPPKPDAATPDAARVGDAGRAGSGDGGGGGAGEGGAGGDGGGPGGSGGGGCGCRTGGHGGGGALATILLMGFLVRLGRKRTR